MVMEELMLVNPESTRRKRRRKQKPLQIIFPKPVLKLRANSEYIDRARTRSKALVGNLTGKHVVGSLGGVAATIAVPNAMRLRGWSDVMNSSAVSIGGGIAVKQMDEGAGDAFMLTGLGVTGLKAVKQLMKTANGKTTRRRRRRSYRRSLGDDEFDSMDDIGIDDFGIDDFGEDEFLGDEDDLLGDFIGDAGLSIVHAADEPVKELDLEIYLAIESINIAAGYNVWEGTWYGKSLRVTFSGLKTMVLS